MLADLLARTGLDVLRFDYFGTGDSFGDGTDFLLSTAVADVGLAIEELGGLSGHGPVSLVGLRLGALVAGLAATQGDARVERAVLWEPPSRGSDHLAELLGESAPDHGIGAAESVEIGGFPLTSDLCGELEAAALQDLSMKRGSVMVVTSSPPEVAQASWISGENVTVEVTDAIPCWVEESHFGAGAVPVHLLRRLTEWLT